MSDLLDLHTLSDPTDRHSLDELRAHLADEVGVFCEFCEYPGDIQPQDMGEGRTMRLCERCRQFVADGQASERSGGDVEPDPADVAEDERDIETRLDSEEAEFLSFYRPKTRERRSGGDER